MDSTSKLSLLQARPTEELIQPPNMNQGIALATREDLVPESERISDKPNIPQFQYLETNSLEDLHDSLQVARDASAKAAIDTSTMHQVECLIEHASILNSLRLHTLDDQYQEEGSRVASRAWQLTAENALYRLIIFQHMDRFLNLHEHAVDEMISRGREHNNSLSTEDKTKIQMLQSLGYAVRLQAIKFSGSEDMLLKLDEAIKLVEEGLRLSPADSTLYLDLSDSLGLFHGDRFDLTQSKNDLEKSIRMIRRALASRAHTSSSSVSKVMELSHRTFQMYVVTLDTAYLNEAAELDMEVVQTVPMASDIGRRARKNAARLLLFLYDSTEQEEHLEAAINAARQVLCSEFVDLDSERYPKHRLGFLLRQRYLYKGSGNDIVEALKWGEEAVLEIQADDYEYPSALMELGSSLYESSNRLGHSSDLDRAITLGQQAIAIKAGKSLESSRRFRLAAWLAKRFSTFGTGHDADEAIQLLQQATEGLDHQDNNFPECAGELATITVRRFFEGNTTVDIAKAFQLLESALQTTPFGHPNRSRLLSHLSFAYYNLYHYTLHAWYWDLATRYGRDALEQARPQSTERVDALRGLALLLRRASTSVEEDAANVDEAVELLSEALDESPPGSEPYQSVILSLAEALGYQYHLTKHPTVLNKAMKYAEESLSMAQANHQMNFSDHLFIYASLHAQRARSQGSVDDCDIAIEAQKKAVELMRPRYPRRDEQLDQLGYFFSIRHYLTRDLGALDQSIHWSRESVAATAQDSWQWAPYSNNLANALTERYLRAGQISDLDEAVQIVTDVIDTMWAEHSERSGMLNSQAFRYLLRYMRTWSALDLDEAIRLARDSVNTKSAFVDSNSGWKDQGHRHLLAVSLIQNYRRTGSTSDFESALVALQNVNQSDEAVDEQDAAMGMLLMERYTHTGEPPYLDDAILHSRRAVASDLEPHIKAGRLHNLSFQLVKRYQHSQDAKDLKESILQIQTVLKTLNATLDVRLLSSRLLMECHVLQAEWEQAFETATDVMALASQVMTRPLDNSDKRHLLRRIAGMACEAAAVTLSAGKHPALALAFLEKGRGVLAASTQGSKMMEPKDVNETHPEPAEVFTNTDKGRHNTAKLQEPEQMQQDLLEESFQDLVSKIRTTSRLEDSLLPPSPSAMKAAASPDSPIVVINISKFRCDAIIVQCNEISCIPLPRLHIDDLQKWTLGNLGAMEVLEWLWDMIFNPILNYLGFTSCPVGNQWPHIWWIPTDALCKFPLHAAGYHLEGSGRTVLDRVVSSYNTSIKAIIRGREKELVPISTRKHEEAALLVDMQKTPGHFLLPNAGREISQVRDFCRAIGLTVNEPKPQKHDVLRMLQHCRIFHFAGHGHSNFKDPSMSYLVLGDREQEHLTASDLFNLGLDKGDRPPFLAYLSACGTGRTYDISSMDEGLHLIGACQVAGFRHVLGTLWNVDDDYCVEMARLIYKRLQADDMTDFAVPFGLHSAARELRDRWRNDRRSHEEQKNSRGIAPQLSGGLRLSHRTAFSASPLVRDTRDITAADNEGEVLQWVPYVHFGV